MEAGTMDPPAGINDGEHPGEHEDEQPQVEEVFVEGSGQLSLEVGGGDPTKATVKIKGKSIDVPAGEFKRGDVVSFVVRLRCDAVSFVDKRDSQTGEVTETERRHAMTVSSLERMQ